MYVWNGFTVVGKRPSLTQNILVTLDEADEQLRNDPGKISLKMFCPHICLCAAVSFLSFHIQTPQSITLTTSA